MSLAARVEAAATYHDFLVQLHERIDPASGWQHIGQLPNLSADDMALCLDAHPDLLDDVLVRPADLAWCLRTEGLLGGRQYVADSVMAQLRSEIRRQLLTDLQNFSEDCETDGDLQEAAARGQSLQEYREWQTGAQR